MPETNFFADVYEVVRLVPSGRVTSYGAIAHYLGARHGARTWLLGPPCQQCRQVRQVRRRWPDWPANTDANRLFDSFEYQFYQP